MYACFSTTYTFSGEDTVPGYSSLSQGVRAVQQASLPREVPGVEESQSAAETVEEDEKWYHDTPLLVGRAAQPREMT